MSAAEIEVRELLDREADAAVGVLARGMRDNPMHVAAYGPDPEWRLRCHGRLMGALFRGGLAPERIAAVREGRVVGVAAAAPIDQCKATAKQSLQVLPSLISLGPRTTIRTWRWLAAWADRDPTEPHVHFGPLAVDADLQGRGIGTLLLREHCARLDAAGHPSYLETDKIENVHLYERFGYRVVAEATVLGAHNWFMWRG